MPMKSMGHVINELKSKEHKLTKNNAETKMSQRLSSMSMVSHHAYYY